MLKICLNCPSPHQCTEEDECIGPDSFRTDADFRNGIIEECAAVLDANAQELNELRDPGMANHDRSLARKIRALKS